jgi:Holliday junction resolvase RusA-like endonuclease
MKFTIPIEPVGQMRARSRIGGGVYKNPQQKTAEQRLLAFAVQHKPEQPLDGPLEVHIDAYMPIPKSMSKKDRVLIEAGWLRPTKKPDADNIAKHLLDCFNEIFWTDDKNIVCLSVRKFYSDAPRWEVEIRPA